MQRYPPSMLPWSLTSPFPTVSFSSQGPASYCLATATGFLWGGTGWNPKSTPVCLTAVVAMSCLHLPLGSGFRPPDRPMVETFTSAEREVPAIFGILNEVANRHKVPWKMRHYQIRQRRSQHMERNNRYRTSHILCNAAVGRIGTQQQETYSLSLSLSRGTHRELLVLDEVIRSKAAWRIYVTV